MSVEKDICQSFWLFFHCAMFCSACSASKEPINKIGLQNKHNTRYVLDVVIQRHLPVVGGGMTRRDVYHGSPLLRRAFDLGVTYLFSIGDVQ